MKKFDFSREKNGGKNVNFLEKNLNFWGKKSEKIGFFWGKKSGKNLNFGGKNLNFGEKHREKNLDFWGKTLNFTLKKLDFWGKKKSEFYFKKIGFFGKKTLYFGKKKKNKKNLNFGEKKVKNFCILVSNFAIFGPFLTPFFSPNSPKFPKILFPKFLTLFLDQLQPQDVFWGRQFGVSPPLFPPQRRLQFLLQLLQVSLLHTWKKTPQKHTKFINFYVKNDGCAPQLPPHCGR